MSNIERDRRQFGDMYDLVVKEDGYQGTYEEFCRELQTSLSQLGSNHGEARTEAQALLDKVRAKVGMGAGQYSYHNTRERQKKKTKRRKAVLKQHRR